MNLLSPQQQGKLERTAQAEMMKKQIVMQAASAKKLEALYIPGSSIRNMTRLQVRSYPLGAFIIMDSEHTGFSTPHTFDDLAEGKHTVQMDYVSETGEVLTKKEDVELKKGRRSICKLHFKEPKTLAEPILE